MEQFYNWSTFFMHSTNSFWWTRLTSKNTVHILNKFILLLYLHYYIIVYILQKLDETNNLMGKKKGHKSGLDELFWVPSRSLSVCVKDCNLPVPFPGCTYRSRTAWLHSLDLWLALGQPGKLPSHHSLAVNGKLKSDINYQQFLTWHVLWFNLGSKTTSYR